MTEIILPMEKVKATCQSPKNLIIFSKPKTGKTELLAQLPNSILIDLEEGSDFVDAVKLKARSIEEIHAIGKAILAQNKPYKYIIIDSLTALEDMCIPYAELLYSRKAIGKSWFKRDADGKLTSDSGKVQYGNILNLSQGGGYAFLREAITKIVGFIETLAPRVIFSAHIKDVLLEKAGGEFNSADLDLTGN